MPDDLEGLYQGAKSALKAKEYDRASGLLKQILVVDDNYKDASRLLAQAVRLKRRRWHNDPRLWGAAGMLALIGIGAFMAPRLQKLYSLDAGSPTSSAFPAPVSVLNSPGTAAVTAIPITWKRISIGQEFARDVVTGFEIDPGDSEVLYVRMEHAGYYKSIDGGVSWLPTRWADAPAEIQSALTAYKKQPQVQLQGAEVVPFVVTSVGPDGNERLYRVEDKSVGSSWSTSQDGGKTWSTIGNIGRPKSVAIAFDAQGSVYTSCGGSLCKYDPNTRRQVTLGAPGVGAATIIAMSSKDQSIIYVAGDGLSVSKDGGQTWKKLNNGLGSVMLQLDTGLGNTHTLYVQSGQCSDDQRNDNAGLPLYWSADIGTSWELGLEAGCYLVKDADQATMYRVGRCADCLGAKGWIWRSSDAGKSWNKVPAPGSAQALVADPLHAGFLYATMIVGWNPLQNLATPQRLFYSQDHGQSWTIRDGAESLLRCKGLTPQTIDSNRPQFRDSNHPMAIDPRDGKHILYVVRDVLFESRDGCIHDNHLVGNAPSGLANSVAFDPNFPSTIYAGTDEGAYISTDDGQSWGQINDGLLGATVVYSIAVDKDSNVYAATPYGIFKLEQK
jgi:photosystem II stability/assembly factor-like uncharacterized protein